MMKKLFIFTMLLIAKSALAADDSAYIWQKSSLSGPQFSSKGELIAYYCAQHVEDHTRNSWGTTWCNNSWCEGSLSVQSCQQTTENPYGNGIAMQGEIVLRTTRCGCGSTDETRMVPMGYGIPLYAATLPESDQPTSSCVLNPIDPISGAKYQIEHDVAAKGFGQVSFSRTYKSKQVSNQPVWRHNYEKKMWAVNPNAPQLPNPEMGDRSLLRGDPSTSPGVACTQGWSKIKSQITDSWAQGASVSWDGISCKVFKNGKVVKTLPVTNNGSVSQMATPAAVQFRRPDGGLISFQNHIGSTNKNYVTIDGDQGALTRINPTTNNPTEDTVVWQYLTKDGELQEYSPTGKLLAITASNRVKQTLTYDATSGLLSSVQDSLGGQLTFAYVGTKIFSVTTKDNKVTSYVYNSAGLLTDVKRPDNTIRKYHYEDSRFPSTLTGITDERGIRFATWSYDDKGRAITSTHANGADSGTVAYNSDGSVTVTNALSKQTIYYFDDIAGARRVVKVAGQPTTNCVGANQNYTYTAEGWIESKTDWNGNKIFYKYNIKGQEISRTEAYGTALARTIATQWHTSLNVKTKVTEADRETVYTYDDNGLLLTQTTKSLL